MNRRVAVVAAIWIGFALWGCESGDETATEVPLPDLAGAEPMVVGVLEDLQREAIQQPESAEAWGRLGGAYHTHGLLDEAAVCYRRAHELAPGDYPWAYLHAVVSVERSEGPDVFVPLFAAATRIDPDYVPSLLRLGQALVEHGETAAAREAFERAVELEPQSGVAWRGLGQVMLADGELGESIEALHEAASRTPDDATIHSMLARAYGMLGLRDLAEAAAAQARRHEPQVQIADPLIARHVDALGASARHWFERSRARLASSDFDGALADLEVVGQTRPDDPDVHYLKGVATARLGRREEALQSLDEALRLNPGHARATLEMARILGESDRGAEALELLRRGVELAPGEPVLLATLGSALASAGDVEGAIAAYAKLSDVAPDPARVHFNLGMLHARRGRFDESTAEFRRALKLDPGHAGAHRSLGLVLERLGDPLLAVDHYREAVRIDPASPAAERLAILESGGAAIDVREEFERVAERLFSGANRYLGRAEIDRLRGLLSDPRIDRRRMMEHRAELARRLAEAGEIDEAVVEVERAMAVARELDDPQAVLAMHRHRGLIYMRKAEVQNCVARHNADCCIFPLTGGGVHAEREPAENARASFQVLLEENPGDLKSRWLLNVMAMALGDYPQDVDESLRLPPESFRSEGTVARFRDVAPEKGVDAFNLCGGTIVDDFDGDGRLDIVTSTFDPREGLLLYRNDGRGGFVDESSISGLADQLGGLNCVGADYDSDGDIDILIMRGAWLMDDGRIRNSLLRNDGNARFTDVTRQAGLAWPAYPTQVAAWGDYDNDGDLDVYIANESRKYLPESRADYPSQLFRNNGDGTFSDIARQAGVTNDRYAKGVAAGDYDNDGDVDLYVSNVLENRLYRNRGDATFEDVARQAGVTEPAGRSFATWFFDYDNDGWLDLFVTGYQATVADLAAHSLGLPHEGRSPRLYRNLGDGTFSDVTQDVGLARPFLPMGANFGDVDGDGWLDIYLATGDPAYESLMPNVMLRNDRGRRFQDVTQAGGFGHLQKGHGVAFADIDDDGDQDIYHQLGGFFPGDGFHNALFQNPGHGQRWLTIKLEGTRSNRAGYGARITVVIETPDGRREIHRAVGSVSSFGGSPSRQEIGLADATSVVHVEVLWPASGTRQVFEDIRLDSRILAVEGAASIREP